MWPCPYGNMTKAEYSGWPWEYSRNHWAGR